MAASAAFSSPFKAPLGNDEVSMEINNESSTLTIEVANASRFVVYRRSISKAEDVRYITGI